MREIIFDTETTGLDPASGDRLVEIGCIELVDRIETGRSFHRYCNPQRPMPSAAERIHGLSDVFLADKPVFADIVDEFLAFIGDDTLLVAHNAAFDFGFVDNELRRCGRAALDRARMVDTVALARKAYPGAKHSLDALCVRYGIDRSHRTFHGALLDAELLTLVYIELNGGRQIGLGLADAAPTADNALDFLSGSGERPFRPARPHTPSPQELARHAEFIGRIEGALWSIDT